MTDTTNTQTVVDAADTAPVAGSEVNDARNDGNDLDTLLAQYAEQTRTAPVSPTPTQSVTPDVNSLAAEVQSLKGAVAEVNNFKFQRDMNEMVKDVRGDMDPEVFDDDFVAAWVDAKARQDTRLQTAWLQKEANPGQFKKVKAELGKAFVKKFSRLPDRQVTEDREAVTAAVRGASTRAPESAPINFKGMSNSEYRKTVRDEYGFDPAV